MSELFELMHQYATHPVFLAGLAVLLIVYQGAAKRSRALPNIPVGLVILYLMLEVVLVSLEPFDIGRWRKYLDIASTVVLYMVVVRYIVAVVMDLWLVRFSKKPLPKITRDFILAVAFIVIVLWVLRTVGGINLASLLTTSAILTAVVGLALQDTLGSFFAGLSLQIERPYKIGDWIMCKGFEGKVVGINWRTTRIHTRWGEKVYIPNNEITKDAIKNFSQPDETHIEKIEFGVEYQVPPGKVRAVVLDALKSCSGVVQEYQSTVRVVEFSDFSVKYAIFTRINDLNKRYILLAEIMNQVWYYLKRAGIRIPFPIRDVNMRQVDVEKEKAEQLGWIEHNLKRIPILKSLGDKELANLAAGVRVENYGVGEQIVHQGDAGDTMYLIQQGVCDVVVEKKDAYAQKVATLTSGDYFGEMSLLTGEQRTATVVAKGEALLIAISREAFQNIIAAHPDISEGLAKALAERQAELDQIKRDAPAVAATTKTLLGRIKKVFHLS
jgi:small-conductance mechanosensitive channel/CRP-like cAMP-binding protein